MTPELNQPTGLYWVPNPFERVAQAWHLDRWGVWRLDSERDMPANFLSGLRFAERSLNANSL